MREFIDYTLLKHTKWSLWRESDRGKEEEKSLLQGQARNRGRAWGSLAFEIFH
jgi:hypothetical protein